MHVTHLSLADFRSYARVEVPLDPGVTAFVGPNGQGKTNLVEAVGYLATLGSHRVSSDAPLVRVGADRAVVRAQVKQGERQQLVELELNPGKANRARINRSSQVRPRDVLGIVRTVLFAPEDLALVKGDPGERRRFLDELITARSPRMAGVRSDYERVLKQRNTLLKSAALARRHGGRSMDLSTLDVWDQHLARVGAELLAQRLDLIAAIQPLADKAYEQLAPGGGPVALDYKPSAPGEAHTREDLYEQLMAALAEARKQEIERGSPSWGRIGTICFSNSVSCRPRGTPPTASRGPTRWRCAWRRTTSSGPRATSRCWSSTTSSPSWTPVVANAWPNWSRRASRSW